MEEIKFSLDTFYALMSGALVMWMAAGFTMLEAGLVQKKDVAEIVTKNLGLYSIACIMYLLCGFVLMYPSGSWFDGSFLSGIFPFIGTSVGLATDMPLEEIINHLFANDLDINKGRRLPGLFGNKKINFNSIRKGEVIGEHEVSFSSGKEIIKLNHESFDRALYSEGALTAAKWLMKKKAGLYSMRDLLNFS